MVRIGRPSFAVLLAGGLAALFAIVVATGISCLSADQGRCSPASLLHGRPALDVPYAGTRPEVVARMLEAVGTGPADYVVDLGTGDGRILIAAARDFGARGLGVDIDPVLVRAAERNARRAGVADRAEFRTEDLFETPLRGASVVAMYLLPEVNLRLRPRLLDELAPGARIVSHAFDMGEWRPDETHRVGGAAIHVWTVPARIGGRWRIAAAGGGTGVLDIEQDYQHFTATLRMAGGGDQTIGGGRIEGDRITFRADLGEGETALSARVEDGRIIADPPQGWRAERLVSEPESMRGREAQGRRMEKAGPSLRPEPVGAPGGRRASAPSPTSHASPIPERDTDGPRREG